MTYQLLWNYGQSEWRSFQCSTIEQPQTEWFWGDPEPSVQTGKKKTDEGRFGLLSVEKCHLQQMQRFTFENKIRSGQSKVFSLRRRCFFSTKYSDELLKVPVLTLGCNLQFFTWQNFVMFANSHQLSEFWIQRLDLIKNYANQSGWKFLSQCFHCFYSSRFHMISWKSSLEISIRTLCRRFDVSRTRLRNKVGSVQILKLTHCVRVL